MTSAIRNHDTYKFFRQELGEPVDTPSKPLASWQHYCLLLYFHLLTVEENLSVEVMKPCHESGLKQLFYYDRTQTIEIVRITPART